VLWSLFSPCSLSATNWKLTPNRHAQALEELQRAERQSLISPLPIRRIAVFHYDTAAILDAFRKTERSPTTAATGPAARPGGSFALLPPRPSHVVDPESIVSPLAPAKAYSYVFRLLCNLHDEILVPQARLSVVDFLADLQDVTLIPYTLEYAHGWFIDFHSVIRALTPRTRAILLVHPTIPRARIFKPRRSVASTNSARAQPGPDR